MMSVHSWFIYLSFVIVITSTPGPAVLLAITNSTIYGWKKAVFSALGNIIGLFCLGVIAITGLGAILKTSAVIFNTIKYAGAAYLIWLGIKLLFNKNKSDLLFDHQSRSNGVSSRRIFIQAFGVAMSNPKAILFLTALFPQFVNVDNPVVPQFSILILTLMLFSFLFLMVYAMVAHKAKRWLAKPGRLRAFNYFTGSIFIGFGVLLAKTSNR